LVIVLVNVLEFLIFSTVNMSDWLSSDDPVFAAYAFYAALVCFKMMIMSLLTARHRLGKGIFANAEDVPLHPKGKVKMDDPDVERVRRGHLNDLENIPVFLILGLLYVATRPALATALWCFRIFVAARYIHTFVYVICPLPQPARGLSFFAGVGVNLFMAYKVVTAFF